MLMRAHAVKEGALLALIALQTVAPQPDTHLPTIFEGIENVANSATNLLFSAVEKPRNLFINATRATTGIIDSAASKGLEFKLRRILEKFRGRMPYGIPELGIPPLEPLHVDEIDLEIDNPDIGNVSVAIQDLNIHNLSTFVINKAKLSVIGPTITANLTLPRILVEGLYNVSGKLGFLVPLHNVGPIPAIVNDFHIYVHAMLGFSRGLYLRVFDLDFSLQSIEANLDEFLEDEELSRVIGKVFQELTPKAVDIIKPDILPGIQSYIGGRINDTIQHLTMRDVIGVLIGRNEIREFANIIIP